MAGSTEGAGVADCVEALRNLPGEVVLGASNRLPPGVQMPFPPKEMFMRGRGGLGNYLTFVGWVGWWVQEAGPRTPQPPHPTGKSG